MVAYNRTLPSDARLLHQPAELGCAYLLIVIGMLLAGYAWTQSG